MNRSEFVQNLKAAGTVAAVLSVGILGGGFIEGLYNTVSKSVGLPVVAAEMRGMITSVVAFVTTIGTGFAYMERN